MTQLVKVYRNLHKACYSIQTKGPNGWRVSCHSASLFLVEPQFIVSETGRQRVIREGKKNVHAFIKGLEAYGLNSMDFTRRISYNPYQCGQFVFRDTQEPVGSLSVVLLDESGVWTIEE